MTQEPFKKKNNFSLALLLLILPGCVGLYIAYMIIAGPPPKPGLKYYIATEVNGTDTVFHKVPDFEFINEKGETVNQDIFNDKIVIADYFFTTCPGICIAMSAHLAEVQEFFKNDEDIFIASHTVDPETDTPAALNDYADQYGAIDGRWTFLTGSKKDLYHQARKGYFITAMEGDGGPEDFIHSEKLVLLDKDRHIRGYYDGTDSLEVQRLIEEVQVLQLQYGTHKKYR